jgi:hypothetical protein
MRDVTENLPQGAWLSGKIKVGCRGSRGGMDTNQNTSVGSTFTAGGHTYRFVVDPGGPYGWDVRVERDAEILWKSHYTDWHRVERARLMFRNRSSKAATRH